MILLVISNFIHINIFIMILLFFIMCILIVVEMIHNRRSGSILYLLNFFVFMGGMLGCAYGAFILPCESYYLIIRIQLVSFFIDGFQQYRNLTKLF